MNAIKTRRPTNLFDALEPRRHMAVDLSASVAAPKGAYGDGDLFDIDVNLKNAGSNNGYPVYVKVVLSKDKTIGNDDDYEFGSTVFLEAKKGTTTIETQVEIRPEFEAGDYYLIAHADPFNSVPESGDGSNITVSKGRDIRVVTAEIASNGLVKGTSRNDVIAVQGNFANTIVTVNGVSKRFENAAHLNPLTIDAGNGNDKITCDRNVNGATVLRGGAGNDTITGGNYNDLIDGGSGNDRLYGNDGADRITGGAGTDLIDGGTGIDRVDGGAGKDKAKRDARDTFSSVEVTFA